MTKINHFGRKQIYFDERGREPLVDNDSGKEASTKEEEKKEFAITEDFYC